MAQLGRALRLGRRSRRFESCRPDGLVVKLVYTPDLGFGAARRGSSTLPGPTLNSSLCYYKSMNDNSVCNLIREKMLEADIVVLQGNLLSYFHEGREYLVLLSVVDMTDWNNTDGE